MSLSLSLQDSKLLAIRRIVAIGVEEDWTVSRGREEHCRGEDESRPCAYIASPIYLFYVYEPVSRLLSTAAAQRARSVNDSARGLMIRDSLNKSAVDRRPSLGSQH